MLSYSYNEYRSKLEMFDQDNEELLLRAGKYLRATKPNHVPVLARHGVERRNLIVHKNATIATFMVRFRAKKRFTASSGLLCMIKLDTNASILAPASSTFDTLASQYACADGFLHIEIVEESVFG